MNRSNEWLQTLLEELVDEGVSDDNLSKTILQSFGESTLRDDFIGTKTYMDIDIFAPEWDQYMDCFSCETKLRVQKAKDAKNAALDAFKSGNMVSACMAFMALGIAIEKVKGLAKDEQKELLLGYGENVERKQHLKKHITIERLLKRKAIYLAQCHWKQDENHTIRISEMAEKVRPELVKFAECEIYPTADATSLIPQEKALKEWLKPNAPEWASKKGRPKNI